MINNKSVIIFKNVRIISYYLKNKNYCLLILVKILPLWNCDPFKCNGNPDKPIPFSPVQRALKFSAVLGTVLLNSSMMILPTIKINKNN
jgi:hypothetical protein